jgi:hypothetical protein
MNEQEFEQWKADARAALLKRYNEEETERIILWFSHIKESDEEMLVGKKRVAATLLFCSVPEPFDLYVHLMARLWLYAPYILGNFGA